MKVRSDFVTNSSSSSFTLIIDIVLKDDTNIAYEAWGMDDCPSLCYELNKAVDYDKMSDEEFAEYAKNSDYVDIDESYENIEVTVSPKQLGKANSIPELIKLLKEGVKGDWDSEMPVFKNPKDSQAAEFIYSLSQLNSMDDIKSITIVGEETNYRCYNREYTYDLETGNYFGVEVGCEFEKDGSSGGDLYFSDINEAEVEYSEEE